MRLSSKTLAPASEGFIVVTVLWILGALSVLVSIYAVYVINTAPSFSTYDERLKAEALISAALELTTYQRPSASATSAPTKGQFSFRLDQASIAVEFCSEAARIDLNMAPKPLLIGLFLTLGARPDDAETYANRVIGWRTAPSTGQDSEASAYRMAHLGYQPRGGNFPHINELSRVRDVPIALVERALPFVTVYSGRPQVNVLDAAPEVVAALPGMTQERLNAFLVQRRISPENAKLMLPAAAQQYASLEGSKVLRVKVKVTFDNGHTDNAEVVVLPFEDGEQPFAVLSWQDARTEMFTENRL